MSRAPKNVDKLRYYKRGSQWLVENTARPIGPGNPRPTTKPTFKYRGRGGGWRDPRNKNRPTKPPARFDPRRQKTPGLRRRIASGDSSGIARVKRILNQSGRDKWSSKKLRPILDHSGRPLFRTVAEFRNLSKPRTFTYANLSRAMVKLQTDKLLLKAFAKRRVLYTVRWKDPNEREPMESTLAFSLGWELGTSQAAKEVERLEENYGPPEEIPRTKSGRKKKIHQVASVLHLLRLWVE